MSLFMRTWIEVFVKIVCVVGVVFVILCVLDWLGNHLSEEWMLFIKIIGLILIASAMIAYLMIQ